MKRILLALLILLVVVLAALQLVPVARSNPPVQSTVPASPEILSLLRRSCFDCHSNETQWPWYSRIAPFSWRIAKDVREGRAELNFSTWDEYSARKRVGLIEEVWEEVQRGEMPLPGYARLHPDARLSPQEMELLAAWAESVVP